MMPGWSMRVTGSDQAPAGSLAVALEAKSGLARENARRHLVEMGLAATPVLETLLQDTRTQVRWEAAMAMKEIADPTSVPSLIDALEDEGGRPDDVAVLEADRAARRLQLAPEVVKLTIDLTRLTG